MKEKGIKKILALVVALMLVGTATAFDASNPASYTVNYIVPADTTFSVSLCGSETTMDFNPATPNSKLVEPDCQVIGGAIAWATITNDGNVNQNFSTNLTAGNPAWVELYISNNTDMSGNVTVSTSRQYPIGWNETIPTASVKLYSRANFTAAVQGTTQRTLQIHSNQS